MRSSNSKFLFIPVMVMSLLACNNSTVTIKNPYIYVVDANLKKTISEMKDLNNKEIYYMDYLGDYKLKKIIEEKSAGNLISIFNFANKELLNGKMPMPFGETTNFGCSAFIAKDNNDHYLYGRNFDYPMDIAPIVVKTSPSDGYKSLSVVNTGFIKLDKTKISDQTTDISGLVLAPYMPMDGMNEKGLTISILVVPGPIVLQLDPTKTNLISSLMVRYILDYCKDIEEAKTVISKFNMIYPFLNKDGNFHYFISDSTGKSVVLEYVKESEDVEYSNKVNYVDSNCVTNFYLTESPYIENKGTGQDRYQIIKNTLSFKENKLSKEEAKELLSLVGKKNNPLEKSTTLWSNIYDLTEKTLRIYNRFDFTKPFDFTL